MHAEGVAAVGGVWGRSERTGRGQSSGSAPAAPFRKKAAVMYPVASPAFHVFSQFRRLGLPPSRGGLAAARFSPLR